MKVIGVFLFACLGCVWAQQTQNLQLPAPASAPATVPNLPEDTVVAIFEDGTKFTMADFKKVYSVLPPQNQQVVLRDRRMFLQQWALMRKLAQMAEQEKLDQKSPTREAIEYDRMQIMSQAKLNDAINNATVDPNAILVYYDQNKEKYKQVKVKAIYISFSSGSNSTPASGKNPLTEEQAKAKALKLLGEIRKGADFVKLVRENSDDETSRSKDGDFATLRPNDNVPEAVRTAVFALKQGEVSEPIRQPNGFYLLRAEELTYRPLSQVRDEIFMQLKQQNYSRWLDETNRNIKVQFTSPEFLGLQPLTVPAPTAKK